MSAPSPHYTEEHQAFRQSLRRWVDREVIPHVEAWEAARSFPRALYAKAAEVGLLSMGFPEAYGGTPMDPFHLIIACEELARPGAGGLSAGLMSHSIGLPPVAHLGREALKARVIPEVLSGEKISALAVTEPSGGSDVANLRTTARRDGDHYVLNGQKTFITSGMRADYITCAVRTGGEGMGGISIILVPGDAPGLSRTPLEKMGWWCSDTATLYFDECRVPAENLIGEENMGFMGLMLNFNNERLALAANAWAFGKVAFEEALGWARERVTFGRPLIQRQAIRHKLVDMQADLLATQAFLERLAADMKAGAQPVAEICMLKNRAVACMEHCASEAVQILGGAGYIQGSRSERIYRETKVVAIGGGASEIMKDLAARQLGW
jgi:acyl-CoA dehydrogenase